MFPAINLHSSWIFPSKPPFLMDFPWLCQSPEARFNRTLPLPAAGPGPPSTGPAQVRSQNSNGWSPSSPLKVSACRGAKITLSHGSKYHIELVGYLMPFPPIESHQSHQILMVDCSWTHKTPGEFTSPCQLYSCTVQLLSRDGSIDCLKAKHHEILETSGFWKPKSVQVYLQN